MKKVLIAAGIIITTLGIASVVTILSIMKEMEGVFDFEDWDFEEE